MVHVKIPQTIKPFKNLVQVPSQMLSASQIIDSNLIFRFRFKFTLSTSKLLALVIAACYLTLLPTKATSSETPSLNLAYQRLNIQNTFYCDCPYSKNNAQIIQRSSIKNSGLYTVYLGVCEYQTRSNEALANSLSWDYIVPLDTIAKSLPCGTKAKKKLFKKNALYLPQKQCENDSAFQAAKNDPVNREPSIGEIKNDRNAFNFGKLDFESRKYGLCDFEVKADKMLAEPREEIRGDIARIHFYMKEKYGIKFDLTYLARLKLWERSDKATQQECAKLIFKTMGQEPPFNFTTCSN